MCLEVARYLSHSETYAWQQISRIARKRAPESKDLVWHPDTIVESIP